MPIDASILNGLKSPQFADPLEQQGKVMNLLAMRQQIQMAPLHQQALEQQLQTGTLENEQRRIQLNQTKDLNTAYQDALTIGPDGTTSIDQDKLTQAVAKAGHGSAIPGILKNYTDFQKSTSELSKLNTEVADKRADYGGIVGAAVQDANYDPHLFLLKATHAVQAKALDGRLVQPYIQQVQAALQQDPSGESARQMVQKISDNLIAGSPAQQKLINERQTAQSRADAAKTARDRLDAELPGVKSGALLKGLQVAGQTVPNNQGDWDTWRANLSPDIQAKVPAMYSPASAQMVEGMAITPAQRRTLEGAAAVRTETNRHNLSQESTAALNTAVAQGRLAQEQTINGMKYGPGTTEYWVKQLQDNPDSIKEMPAELRSNVGKGFTQATGLPLPTPASAASQTQETAARNALDGASFIQEALKNPEIRANLGPIMGRLGNAEQALGTAPNLSPEASRLAQDLRTRMRYFVFSEGKAVLGGRLPANLMKQLEESSPSPKMDPDMLAGALQGAVGNAKSVMDNVDRGRFGGKMRPAGMRSGPGSGQQSNAVPSEVQTALKSAGPGIHTLSDGSKWMTDASGNITKQ